MDYIKEFEEYRDTGVIRNKFVAAFLENNFYELLDVPERDAFVQIPELQKWLRENLDESIWGNQEKVEAYQASKGIS